MADQDKPTVAVISMGAMGSGIAARLGEHGVPVLTWLDGRSTASIRRAEAAGAAVVDLAGIARADIVLSIVPPGNALDLAERLAAALAASASKPVYVDCNAVSVPTVREVGQAIAPTGCPFVDGGIIGGPPRPGQPGPAIYVAGEAAPRIAVLNGAGLDIRVMEGAVGAASALKMSYAGITKGLTALGAVMMLAASRGGTAEALRSELRDSQPELFRWLSRSVPSMLPKAYRWVAEMEEIASFVGDDAAAADIFQGAARVYSRIAVDAAESGQESALLRAFDS